MSLCHPADLVALLKYTGLKCPDDTALQGGHVNYANLYPLDQRVPFDA